MSRLMLRPWRVKRTRRPTQVDEPASRAAPVNMTAMSAPPDIPAVARKLRAGDRATLARAITLIESKRADHQSQAHRLVQQLLAETGRAVRVGITGSPGVGKSATIDALGTALTGAGHKVAVL